MRHNYKEAGYAWNINRKTITLKQSCEKMEGFKVCKKLSSLKLVFMAVVKKDFCFFCISVFSNYSFCSKFDRTINM